MQKKLYLFNPETDLALADGRENYLAPRSIRKMAEDLSSLPRWYAEAENEYVVFDPESDTLLPENITEIVPWGWNPALVRRLKSIGAPEQLMPGTEQLAHIRRLSHRSLTVDLQKELPATDCFCSSATKLFSDAEVAAFATKEKHCLFKAPWSSSGKGLRFCYGSLNLSCQQWCSRVISIQGSIIGERLYNKVEDFAMEFYSNGQGAVSFIGYSHFLTDEHGKYKGNYLAADAHIENVLSGSVNRQALLAVKEALIERLPVHLTGYKGYLGVDMMICRFSEEPVFRIHPCVEVNLRMNMGIVARRIADRHLAKDSTGHFRIDYFADPQELAKNHQEQTKAFPLLKADGKVASGYEALTPVNENTNYRAAIWVES